MLDAVLGASAAVRSIQSRCARALLAAGMRPNVATALAAATGVGAAIAFCRDALVLGIALLAVSAAFDALDGPLAREGTGPTVIGGVLDLSADRLVETAVIVGIAWPHPELYLAALLLLGSWYVNITVFLAVGAALEHRGPKLIDYPPGILERTEALIFFTVLAIVESIGFLRALGPLLCYAMTAAEVATAIQRLAFGWRRLRAPDEVS
jgi:archaetidylinositol phosphate synthase